MTKKAKKNKIRFAFFGTSRIAVGILDILAAAGHAPEVIVCTPDALQGRGMKLVRQPVKTWALEHGVAILQPEKLDSHFLKNMRMFEWDVFVVVDYGKMLPNEILQAPRRGCLNVHFSLLPRYRGASPIRSAILNDDRNVGTSIILLAPKLDEGPIVAQKKVQPGEWPPHAPALEDLMISESGKLLVHILPEWVNGQIEAREQNNDIATYCEKFEKEAGLLDLADNDYKNLLKIRAYEGWPGTYAFFERNGKRIRVQILDAYLDGKKLVIDRVKPEGKREMRYEEFLRSGAKPSIN